MLVHDHAVHLGEEVESLGHARVHHLEAGVDIVEFAVERAGDGLPFLISQLDGILEVEPDDLLS